MRFEDFVLHLDSGTRGGFRARVLRSPFGEGAAGFSLPLTPGLVSDVRGGSTRDLVRKSLASTTARPLAEIGSALFRSVFQGPVRMLLDKSRGRLELSPNLGLRIKIKIDPTDDEVGALADLPWELLCDGETSDFLVLSRQMSIVRYLDVPRPSHPIPFTPPLRVLAVGASPRGLEELNLEEEERRLEALNGSSSGVRVHFLQHASIAAVREALSKDNYHVLHFMGHGSFDSESGEGMLAFESQDGSCELVSGQVFAAMFQDLRSLGVLVLNACNTARARHQPNADPFRGVANALVLGGIPAVVAMQQPISDRASIGFSSAFYRLLACGASIDEALTDGRRALHATHPLGCEWATPVLFLRAPEGQVFRSTATELCAGPPLITPAQPRPRQVSTLLACLTVIALLILTVNAKIPVLTNSVPRPVVARVKAIHKLFQTKTSIFHSSTSNTFQTHNTTYHVSQVIPTTAPAITPREPSAPPTAPSLNPTSQDISNHNTQEDQTSLVQQTDPSSTNVPQTLQGTSTQVPPENTQELISEQNDDSCGRHESLIAFFQDSSGMTSPIRDTNNIDNDMDWLGLRFTEFDGSRIRLGVLGFIEDSAEIVNGNYAQRVSRPAPEMQQLLTDALHASKRFDVIEPKRLNEIQEQQTHKESDGSYAISIMNIGKASGAQYLIYGTVFQWNPGTESLVRVSLSLADISTGQTFFVSSERAFIGRREIGLHISAGRGETQQQVSSSTCAIRSCANKAAFKIASFFRVCTRVKP